MSPHPAHGLTMCPHLGSGGFRFVGAGRARRGAYAGSPTVRPVPIRGLAVVGMALMITWAGLRVAAAADRMHDMVIRGGRVIDPESGLDAIRDVAIDGSVVTAVSAEPLAGRDLVPADGLVVAPGFIDLHQHAWDDQTLGLKVRDGVTAALELEIGTADVSGWYRGRAGGSPLHYGVAAGHAPARMAELGDPPAFLPPAESRAGTVASTPDIIAGVARRIEAGLDEGAVAVGFGLAYTPAATDEEIREIFRVAARNRASCHVHLRGRGPQATLAAAETARLAAGVGAALHIVHAQATASGPAVHDMLRLLERFRAADQDVTAEVYPWTAGMTEIASAIFADGWRERLGVDYGDLQWVETGERLTPETFARHRQQGGMVIVHRDTAASVATAVAHPLTMIASDGLVGHPRNVGTSAMVLGRHVRETGDVTLAAAIAKLSLLPARRLEKRVPAMRRKGRIRVGADADLVLFDPRTVAAGASYDQPLEPSRGIVWVFVAGTAVVRGGEPVAGVFPGLPIRGAAAVSDQDEDAGRGRE